MNNIGHLFIGNALCRVVNGGKLTLPSFVRSTLDLRSGARTILVGAHESDSCLLAYDRTFSAALARDCNRRRIAEEAADPALHHARTRRIFGLVEEAGIDARGRVELPAMMRRRARIDDLALVVGTGGAFEIWSPQAALDSGDPALRELAAFHLDLPIAA
jgi:DNA-binding transcriptional regulator/RsmH inhibitor MraZ